MKPVIGITCDYDWEKHTFQLKSGYVEGIYRCGGMPFLIPPLFSDEASNGSNIVTGIIHRIHGLLLSGGQDVHPRYFQEQPHISIGRVNPFRDQTELSLCRQAVKIGIPVFGICRGIQLMNIALGGDIYQDLMAQAGDKGLICHDQPAPKWFGFHNVHIKEGSRLHHILGTTKLSTNTFHHQAVRRPAPQLEIAATAPDGVIEAVECSSHPFLIGVQWHPECMLEDPYMIKLFQAFVEAAGKICDAGNQP
ncbi:MAG: gamma-glutamyl-gamma-aminobutyrate hydrolase family protein [Caldicoprobacterales bacterium]|jgi:putative glutamine amidotransferase|nr:gamma-glutamyl-gamma-aminobutyrate hydrolase family protein [Clostridiales bacterium]